MGIVHIPWYATGFRGDRLEQALVDVSASSLRYGATSWVVHRSRDDRYRLLQMIEFEDKTSFERWWEGPEMVDFRVITSSWWQVPVLYTWNDVCGEGHVTANGDAEAPATATATAPRRRAGLTDPAARRCPTSRRSRCSPRRVLRSSSCPGRR